MDWACKLYNFVGTKEIVFEPAPGSVICGETQLVDANGEQHSYKSLAPGTMFYVPQGLKHRWPWYYAKQCNLSDYYTQHNSHRRPLLVILPGREIFAIDGKCRKDGEAYGGWTITGDAPLITVSPSINIGGSYHGFLQNGVISADCEGRQFDEMGVPLK